MLWTGVARDERRTVPVPENVFSEDLTCCYPCLRVGFPGHNGLARFQGRNLISDCRVFNFVFHGWT